MILYSLKKILLKLNDFIKIEDFDIFYKENKCELWIEYSTEKDINGAEKFIKNININYLDIILIKGENSDKDIKFNT